MAFSKVCRYFSRQCPRRLTQQLHAVHLRPSPTAGLDTSPNPNPDPNHRRTLWTSDIWRGCCWRTCRRCRSAGPRPGAPSRAPPAALPAAPRVAPWCDHRTGWLPASPGERWDHCLLTKQRQGQDQVRVRVRVMSPRKEYVSEFWGQGTGMVSADGRRWLQFLSLSAAACITMTSSLVFYSQSPYVKVVACRLPYPKRVPCFERTETLFHSNGTGSIDTSTQGEMSSAEPRLKRQRRRRKRPAPSGSVVQMSRGGAW